MWRLRPPSAAPRMISLLNFLQDLSSVPAEKVHLIKGERAPLPPAPQFSSAPLSLAEHAEL